jgi:hypothetical protein
MRAAPGRDLGWAHMILESRLSDTTREVGMSSG